MKQQGKRRSARPGVVTVHLEFEGADADRFLRYKESQYLKNNSEAGRKLMFERLAQVEKAKQEEAA